MSSEVLPRGELAPSAEIHQAPRISAILLLTSLAALDILLGAFWVSLAGGPVASYPIGALNWGVAIIVSPAFLIAAGAELLAFALLRRRDLDLRIRSLLIGQAAILLLTPTLLTGTNWAIAAAFAGVGLFVALFVIALQFIYRTKQLTPSTSRLLVRWTFAATLIGAGWFAWQFYGSSVALAIGIVAELVVGLWATLEPLPASRETALPWLLHPFWVFQILLFTFVAEFFLGALLDLLIAGPTFLQFIPFLPYTGAALNDLGIAIYNGLWFAAAILASAWFLIVMGFTMGTLVVFKMRETRDRALRYRMGLMLGVYAFAAIYIPSLASSTPITGGSGLGDVPYVGWGFGLRSGGPFEATAFFAIMLMFGLVAVLTILFGRKALCAVMCGAAMVYQGSTVSEMRSFNQTSRVGRYFLGSQLSTAYVVASSLALVSLFAISFLGFLGMLPAVLLPNGEVDTSALPLPIELYFGALWFAMFVSVPYIGTYNCATTGLCHWGAFSIPFAKISLFSLKVRDRTVCQQCTTFDCAKSCPVGLVDMPLAFRTKGEFRSTKCCGVGTCVGACPYGNLYHQDVRHWVLKWGRGNPIPPPAARLPMVAAPGPAGTADAPATTSSLIHP